MTSKEAKKLAQILHTQVDAVVLKQVATMHPDFYPEIIRLEEEWEKDQDNLTESERAF